MLSKIPLYCFLDLNIFNKALVLPDPPEPVKITIEPFLRGIFLSIILGINISCFSLIGFNFCLLGLIMK